MQLSEEKLEAMLKTCVPGGSLCDPQAIADDIREWFSAALRAQADARPVWQIQGAPDSWLDVDEETWKWSDESRRRIVYTHPEASAPGLSEADRNVIESAIREVELSCQYALAEDLRAILTRASAATVGEASNVEGPEHLCPEPAPGLEFDARGALVKSAQQQVEPESVIKRQAQKIGELIADRDSWIEAHARLYRLYHDQSPKAGEEIHVNVEGGDVYTLPLQLSGMDKPRFVVHVPCSPQPEPGADERADAMYDMAFVRGMQMGWNFGENGAREDYDLALKARDGYVKVLRETRAAQSGQRAGVAEEWTSNHDANAALLMLDRLDVQSDDDARVDAIAAIIRRLAAAPTQQQEGGS